MKSPRLDGHFIPNSHLDREWGLDYQQTRKLTVDFLDALLRIFEQVPEYQFLLDSQTVPLEDYLEVRPENREKLQEAVRQGRLSIGPWYTAPDGCCLRGESIVRNLLMGHRVAKDFGPVMKVGYTPFGFGQISQLPQIYQGFGIDTAFFYRGITEKNSPAAEFIWEAPDGTSVLGCRFGCAARYNFYMYVWRPVLYQGRMLKERLFEWREGGVPFKLCDAEHRYDNYFLLQPKSFYDPSAIEKYFRQLIPWERRHFTTPVIPLMQGMDSSMPDPLEAELLKEIQAYLQPGERVRFSSLPEFTRALKQALKGCQLKRFTGEMRLPVEDGFFTTLAGDTISNRPRQKQLSEKAEWLLERWAEPFAVLASLVGEQYPDRYLEIAWKTLLKCHAHDTIGGCGVDAVEEDATWRLDQVCRLSTALLRSSLGVLQKQIDTTACAPEEITLTVFNPSPFERTEVVQAFVDVPDTSGIVHVRLFDSDGKEADLYEGHRRDTEKVIRSNTDVTTALKCHEVAVQFVAESVPAMGYKSYVLRGGPHVPRKIPLAQSPAALENEYLRAEFASDGTLSLLHKPSGKVYPGLHVFEDGGEAGEPWTRKPPARDKIITSRGAPAQIAIADNSHLSGTIQVRTEMMIPVGLEHDTEYHDTWRTEEEAPLVIKSFFTLRKGCPFLEVENRLENRHKNHRLRVLFPTGLKATHSAAEQPYDVVERVIPRGKNHPYRDTYNPTYPLLRFVALDDGHSGLALLSDGIREYEAMDDPQRTLALTLIRAFEIALCTVSYRWEHLPEMLGSQSLGAHVFRYGLFPFSGSWQDGDLLQEAERFSLPLLTGQSTRTEAKALPPQKSFIQVSPASIQLSGLKRAENGKALILRLYNPTKRRVNARIHLGFAPRRCSVVTLEEKPSKERFNLKASGQRLTLTFPPGRIITLKIGAGRVSE